MESKPIVGIIGFKNISGGNIVILEHALHITRRGNIQVVVVVEEDFNEEDFTWFKHAEEISKITYKEAKEINFDILIATFWKTCYDLYKFNSKNYFYFNQSVESRFYPFEDYNNRNLADATYLLGLNIITEATWIKDYLFENYNLNCSLVQNGINKGNFKLLENKVKSEDVFRVLVEGPLNVPIKNVEKTIALCLESQADEVWLLTSTEIANYPGVDKVFSKVPVSETAIIYNSCDVLVKLSRVEGMFGPPLEMFHCGGTSISYNVSGFEEYMIHGENCLVVEMEDETKVLEFINLLKNDRKFLNRLKSNALKTAAAWIDWEVSSSRFEEVLLKRNQISVTRSQLTEKSRIMLSWYDNISLTSVLNLSIREIFVFKIKSFLKRFKKYIVIC